MKFSLKFLLVFCCFFGCFFVLCWLVFFVLHFIKISILPMFLQCFVDVGFSCCYHSCVHFWLFLALIFGPKNQWKIIKKSMKNRVDSGSHFWRPLGSSWASLGDLLGLSWAPLGTQNGAQEGEDHWPKAVFCNLDFHHLFFFDFCCLLVPLGPILGAFWPLRDLSWEGFWLSGGTF